jgi:prevent-host-death family protein
MGLALEVDYSPCEAERHVVTLLHGGEMPTITTVSSREFNQDVSRVKKAAERGPVMITDRGRPAHVLLSIEEYQKLTARKQNILELISCPEADAIDFEIPMLGNEVYKPYDFS